MGAMGEGYAPFVHIAYCEAAARQHSWDVNSVTANTVQVSARCSSESRRTQRAKCQDDSGLLCNGLRYLV